MSAELVCLTLIAARSFRDELFDYLNEQRDLVSGFTASDAAGHGPDVRLQTSAERVKGHADELMVRTILQAQHAAQLLQRMKAGVRWSEDDLLDHAGLGIWRDRCPKSMSLHVRLPSSSRGASRSSSPRPYAMTISPNAAT